MATSVYTVPSTKIVHETKVDFSARHDYCSPIYLMQYDNSIPIIAVSLRNNQTTYKLDDSHEVWIRWRKTDNTFVRKKALGCNSAKNVVYFEVTQQMVIECGSTNPVVELVIPASSGQNPQVASSASFSVIVERNPIQNGDIESVDVYEDPNGNVCYSKEQIDANFYTKNDIDTNFYSASRADARYYTKEQANNNFYKKSQADARFAPFVINTENIGENAVGFGQLDADSVGFVHLLSDVVNLLDMINKSNYTLLFDANFKLVTSYDTTTIGAGVLNASTAKYAFISKKVKNIQAGASAAIPNVTNVYVNNFDNNISIASDAFSSSVSISYVNQVPDFNMLDYIAKDLLSIHADIKSKYDTSNIEYGTATLTPYNTQTELTKTASCIYKRVGNTVTVINTLVMNECTLTRIDSVLNYLNMPFKCSVQAVRCLATSNNNKVLRAQVTSSAWLQLRTVGSEVLSFANGEIIDVIITYKCLGYT